MPPDIQNKHILIETCVISDIFSDPKSFEPLLKELESLNCKLAINDLIYLEFVRIAKNLEEKHSIEKFLITQFYNIPFSSDLLESAKKLYAFYNHCKLVKNKAQVSIVDLMNVAYLDKY